jgi:signal transduction histidine kinase/CheY-like chemotaxis protein
MKSIKLKNPYLISSLLSSVILLALIVFFSNVKEKNISANLVEHSNKVIKRSNDLFLDLIQHQTGIRGYMITNDTSFLQPYTNSLPNIKKHFKELRNLTKENQLQQHWLDSLETLIKQRTELSENIILKIKELAVNSNQQVSIAEEGKIIADNAKLFLTKIINHEYKLLEQRKTIDANKEDKQFLLFIILFSTSLFILILSLLNIRKHLKEVSRSQNKITGLEQNAIKLKSENELAEEKDLESQKTIASKQQFLSNMSHEIRTPMTAIIGFSKVVLKTELTTKQREYIEAIKTSSDALLVLINDILDLAKVDAGKMTFEQNAFDMESDISAMLHLFDLKIQEKNLELIKNYDKRIPKILLGDSVRLNQIILNLISNAVKFTSKGSITLSVKLVETTEETVIIKFEVADTGIGVAENMLPTIFESFQQATSSTTRQYGGTGLGLAIVKQLVEWQGGTINVKSKINEGSTFNFVLSFRKSKGKIDTEIIVTEPNPEIKMIRILAVEDMPLNRMLLKIILDEFGFQSDFAENGREAIEKLKATMYDVILMDIQMPVMGGLEATEFIRNQMKSKIPIIALTADVTMEDLEKCKVIGMNDHVSKPIDEKQLFNKIVALVINTN